MKYHHFHFYLHSLILWPYLFHYLYHLQFTKVHVSTILTCFHLHQCQSRHLIFRSLTQLKSFIICRFWKFLKLSAVFCGTCSQRLKMIQQSYKGWFNSRWESLWVVFFGQSSIKFYWGLKLMMGSNSDVLGIKAFWWIPACLCIWTMPHCPIFCPSTMH